MRFVVIFVLVLAVAWLVRRALLRGPLRKTGDAPGKPQAGGPVQGDLVKCAHCGTHLPLAEARAVGERLYCSEEHARLGAGRG